ncbi:MAG: 2,3-bisphosphoglycerate-independent phosphoglycerate mutase, partial [Proteobacteria bacterium]|nr:2,3-bisphosphoglycerate-independent phosphoglycerate mutase [Pseudomonadota bacterium]
MKSKGPVLLAILDGWGLGGNVETNAVYAAKTPNMDRWWNEYPHTALVANGGMVGLPEGQMGNSEVGHLNIGAGRVVYQDYSRINIALESGEFMTNPGLLASMNKAKEHSGALHLLGLVSDGGVHSHLSHLIGLLQMASALGLERVFIHAFMDGRDTPPRSGLGHLETLQKEIDRIGTGRIATITGRYYAMDRDNRWQRVELAWKALVSGDGVAAADPVQGVRDAYDRGESDEFIKPVVMVENNRPLGTIQDHDSVIFFNFRSDRARELTRAFTEQGFTGFDTGKRPELSRYLTFTEYDRDFTLPIAFPPAELTRILGEEVSRGGLTQLRIAETEKYAHVTFFFNGGREEPFPGEERLLVPSPKEVATYDLKPEMSAGEVTDRLLQKIGQQHFDLVVLNYANGDMVGHTGMLPAAIKACETVDACLGRLVEEFLAREGTVLITADHGNAEQMVDPVNSGPFTAHTSNRVPFIAVGDTLAGHSIEGDGALRDIAPTVLTLLGLPVPEEM